MAEQGNSAHIYRLADSRFRLTFVSASSGGASFLSEIGDFTRWGIEDWLKDHLSGTGYWPRLMQVADNTEEF